MLYHISVKIWSVVTVFIMANLPKRPKTDGVMMNFTSKSNNGFPISLNIAAFKAEKSKLLQGGAR